MQHQGGSVDAVFQSGTPQPVQHPSHRLPVGSENVKTAENVAKRAVQHTGDNAVNRQCGNDQRLSLFRRFHNAFGSFRIGRAAHSDAQNTCLGWEFHLLSPSPVGDERLCQTEEAFPVEGGPGKQRLEFSRIEQADLCDMLPGPVVVRYLFLPPEVEPCQ